jgi:hypothetical protein
LCNDYLTHNISIREIGRSSLNNTTYFTKQINLTDFNNIITIDTHSNAIDIYLLSPTETFSRANGIPGNALAIGGDFVGTSVLSHEFGHCLGLFHTHSGRGCGDNENCAENINGTNCSTCGDLICDTPADPCLSGNVTTNCEYTGSSDFHPDVHNIMSYAPPTCLTHLTTGQNDRMHSTIMNSSIILARSFDPDISGTSVVCASGTTFTIAYLPSGYTVSWTCTSTNNNLSIDSSTGYAHATSNISGTGTITAVLHTACGNLTLPAKTVWVGLPLITSISGPSSVGINEPASFTAQLSLDSSPTSYYWTTSPSSGVTIYPDGRYASMSFANSGTYQVVARAQNSCGWSDYFITYVDVTDGYYLAISPNPTTTEATIELVSTSTEKATKETEWDLEVYDAMQSMKAKVEKIKNNKQTLNTQGWKEGVYIVRAIIGKDVITGKLVVKP